MTSVIHDFTKLSAGSFTLYDTNMMDGHREGRTLSGRRGSGSYEMYPEHRISPGESNNRKSPNLGQAPGCPGSLPESTQVIFYHNVYSDSGYSQILIKCLAIDYFGIQIRQCNTQQI